MTIPTLPANPAIHALLAERREIAIIWCIDDVHMVRPDLSDDSAWTVLQSCKRYHDATLGISWDFIRCIADGLFPSLNEGREA